MVAALTLAFALRWASFYAANQIDTDPYYIGVLYALPIVSAGAAILSLGLHKRLSIPAAVSERATGMWRQDRTAAAFRGWKQDTGRPSMIFGTLGRYFFRRYLATTIWFFLGVIVDRLPYRFQRDGRTNVRSSRLYVTGGLLMTAVRLPLIIQQTVPFIALFVGMTVLIGFNRKYELVVARAAGISVWQFMSPFLLARFLLGVLTMTVINPLAAWGQRQAALVETDWRGRKRRSSSKPQIPWLRQISGRDDVIIGARTIQENGTLLIDAVLIHFDSERSASFCVRMQPRQNWKMVTGFLRTLSNAGPAKSPFARIPSNFAPI